MRFGYLVAASLMLAGCSNGLQLPSLPSLGGLGDKEPVTSLSLLSGDVTAQAPDGYCIDTSLTRPNRGFVVMAGCALVSSSDQMPATDGLLTLQVGDAGTASIGDDPSALRDLLATAAGAELLSSNGDPTSIEIDDLQVGNGAVFVHFDDMGPRPAEGLEEAEWRAFFDIGDRFATLTLRGFERAEIEDAQGLTLIRVAVSLISEANRVEDAGAEG